MVLKGERKILSQSEWVDKKRTERPTDFAPPTNYDKGVKKQATRRRPAEPGTHRKQSKCSMDRLSRLFHF